LTDQIATTVEEVVEESTTFVLAKYEKDPLRRSELDTAIRQDTTRLFAQIERGLTVEFRAKGKEDASEEEQKSLANIENTGKQIKFPQIAREPMLLSGGEILEGEIRTVKKKTTTTHKAAKKEPKDEK
jgi:hypothetical protein